MSILIATDYVILRGVKADGRSRGVPLDREPVRVATLINEDRFNETGAALLHHDTVFLEDRVHDWLYSDGNLRYYTRIAEKADVVVVFAMQEIPGLFCGKCGKPVHPKSLCECPQSPAQEEGVLTARDKPIQT